MTGPKNVIEQPHPIATSPTPAPCAGQWVIFDSTTPADHREAARVCDPCPLAVACRAYADQLDAALKTRTGKGIVGTWGGRLYGRTGRPATGPTPTRTKPRRASLLTDNQVAAASILYATGATCAELAERFGVSGETIRRRMKESGLQMRPAGWRTTDEWSA